MVPMDRASRSLSPSRKNILLTIILLFGILALGSKAILHWRQASRPDLRRTAGPQQDMRQILADLNSKQDPMKFRYLNSRRAAILQAQMDDPENKMTAEESFHASLKLAEEFLNAGQTEKALELYSKIERNIQTNSPESWESLGAALLTFEAVGHLRQGELQNCCDRNNPHSCLLPISGSGIHTKQGGSRGAIKCLLEALKLDPANMSARWLLNIAYMTVGEYPGKVPSKWLIPLKNYGGEQPMNKFVNAAPTMGLDMLGLSGSVIMEDFEGSGLLDIVVSSFKIDGQLRYFHNNGDGTFTERTEQAGLIGEVGGLNMITTDYNNDGRPDIVVLRGGWMDKTGHYPLSLLRNDGGGHFTDVTIQAGLLSFGPTQTAVAFDYNSDGWLDLFVGYESTPGDPVPCKLFRNKGDGTFTDVTTQCGLNAVAFVKGAVTADFTHSGRPGLYLSCWGQGNILLRNDGPAGPDKSAAAPWKFTQTAIQAGVDLQRGTFSCFFFDYDNDGWPDLYVGGYGGVKDVGDVAKDYLHLPTEGEKAKLYHNNRDGTFTDVSKAAHLDRIILGMGINYGDLDNDGWLDFYAGTGNPDLSTLIPNRMFRNHDGKYFDEVTTTGDFGHLQKGHGIAFGDINNNGQQDVFLVAGGAYEGDTAHDCLFINPGNENHWVTLSLTGVNSSRIALGAEICVTIATPQGTRKIFRTVSTGGSFGNNPLRQEIGLGNARGIEQVTIRWPASGIQQTVKSLNMDCFYKIREGDHEAVRWSPPSFKMPGSLDTKSR